MFNFKDSNALLLFIISLCLCSVVNTELLCSTLMAWTFSLIYNLFASEKKNIRFYNILVRLLNHIVGIACFVVSFELHTLLFLSNDMLVLNFFLLRTGDGVIALTFPKKRSKKCYEYFVICYRSQRQQILFYSVWFTTCNHNAIHWRLFFIF